MHSLQIESECLYTSNDALSYEIISKNKNIINIILKIFIKLGIYLYLIKVFKNK